MSTPAIEPNRIAAPAVVIPFPVLGEKQHRHARGSMELITAFPIDSIAGVNEEPDSCSSFAGIVQHIKEHGVLHPVLIDKATNTLIAGQARVQACKKLGISTIPAMLDDYNPGSPEAKLIAIEDDFLHKWLNKLELSLRIHKWKQAYLQLHPCQLGPQTTDLHLLGCHCAFPDDAF